MKDKKKIPILYSTRQKEQKSCKQLSNKLYFQTILQRTGEGVLVLDRDLKIQMANRFLLGILKREEKEVIGKHCYRLIHGREEPCLKCPASETFKTGKPMHASQTGTAKDGSTTYVDLSFYPIFDENGRVIQVIEVAIDVSKQKQSEKSLKESEARFRGVFESKMIGILFWDAQGRISDANNTLLQMIGYSRKELLARKLRWTDITPPEFLHLDERALNEIFRDGTCTPFEKEYIHKDGRRIPILIFGASLPAPKLSGVAIVLDITKHKQAEEQNKAIVFTAMDGFLRVDRKGNILEVNDAYCSMTGYSREELLSMRIADIEAIESPKDIAQRIQRITKKGRERFETQHRCKNGRIIDLEVSANYLQIGEGSFFAFMRDITERKRAEEEKEKMQMQLLHSEKLKVVGQLAGGIAHEFNNILMALMGYAETIQKEMNKNDPLRNKIDRILSLTKKASGFTRSLLTFSRKNVINPKIVAVDEIVENVKKLLLNLLGEDIELTTKFSTKKILVKADTGQIEQILMNLATNARDAMPDGGRILIKTGLKEINKKFIKKQGCGECGSYAFLTFTDTGNGMDKKTLEKIFEPFFTTKDTGKGTGLGLSTVYGIIKQHKGFIDVQSRLGVGTTFEIYFPLMQPADMNNIKNEVIPLEGGGTETILLAEDNEDVRKMIKDELVKFGYSVIEAVDGEDAVKVFKKKKETIQLLLFDVIMPRKNGKKAYEEIKKENPGIKHIFMSGYSKNLLDTRGIDSKEINYIFKPISIFELLRTVRKVLDKKK